MLRTLQIDNFAIIDHLELEFGLGFNAITGESGSGKSLIIKALDALRGEKVEASLYPHTTDKIASVCATWTIKKSASTLKLIHALDIPLSKNADGSFDLLVRRTLTHGFRSKAFINDVAVSLTTLKLLSKNWLDILGQDQNQKSLNERYQTKLFDKMLDKQTTSEGVRKQFIKIRSLVRTLTNRIETINQNHEKADYLRYRFETLDKFAPSVEDYREILNYCQNAQKRLEVSGILKEISQYFCDDDYSLLSQSLNLKRSLEKFWRLRADSKPMQELATEIHESINQLAFLTSQLAADEFDPETFDTHQHRLAKYQEFFRQLGVFTIEELIERKDSLAKTLVSIDKAGEEIHELLKQILDESLLLQQKALRLEEERKQAEGPFAALCHKELRDLSLEDCFIRFQRLPVATAINELDLSWLKDSKEGELLQDKWQQIQTILTKHSELGASKINFEIKTSPSSEFGRLTKVASGGERSRIALALNKIFLRKGQVQTLVLDEIDVGVSGRCATKMGQKIKAISKDTQVICISHLAQVASFAQNHLGISKQKISGQLIVKVAILNSKTRVEELAKLLSGEEISQSGLANATGLLKEHSPS